jgi:YD repeat-containing protein
MVSIFTGLGAGFERGSGTTLGASGLLGSGTLGRSGEQVSLNAATGNLLISKGDEFLVGRGPDVSIARTYNSLGDLSDDNGDNWRQSTDRRVYGLTGTVNASESTIKRVSGDGSEITYAWNGTSYRATDGAGAFDTLSYNGSTWTWTDGDSLISETYANVYNGQWRITAATDTNGNALNFSYDGANLTRVTTANGEYEQYVWSGNNITQIVTGYTDLTTNTAKTLTRTRYGYDGANRLTSVTVDLTPDDNSIADGKTYVTTYTYDGDSKRVASISETDGSALSIDYDASGRVIKLTQAVSSGVTRTTNISYVVGSTTITDLLGQVTTLEYNDDGSLRKVTAPPAYVGAVVQSSSFTYDAAGNVLTTTDALGAVTSYTYDENGNVLTTTDPLGNVVSRTYGSRNEVLTETRIGADANSPGASHTTRFVYDGAGQLFSIVSPEGKVSRYFHIGVNLATKIEFIDNTYDVSLLGDKDYITSDNFDAWRSSAALGNVLNITYSTYSYDVRGNIINKVIFSERSPSGIFSYDQGYSRTDNVYDQSGRLLKRTTLGRNSETFVYDGLGRVIASTDLNGATTNIVFNDAANSTVVTLANGFTTTSTYDKAGALISVTEGGNDTNGGTATYGYDQDGRLRVTTDATGHQSYILYDKAGRKVGDVDAYGALVEYRYDADNRLVATARYINKLTAAQIAGLQNPLAASPDIASLRPAAHSADVWNWTVYDADGRVSETIAGDGSVALFQYDGSSQLTGTTSFANKLTSAQLAAFQANPPSSVILPSADARDSVARNFYNKDGLLIGTLDGEGFLTKITYDGAGRKVAVTAFAKAADGGYRANGTFSQLVGSVGTNASDRTERYVYDGQGSLRFEIDALGHVVEYRYKDAVGIADSAQPRQIIRYAGTIGVLADYRFAAVTAAVAALSGDANNRSSWAIYDVAGRLAYAIDAAGAVTGYSYDQLGRLIKTTQFSTSRATDTLPDLATMVSWQSGAGTGNDRVNRNYYAARGELRFTVDTEGYVTRFDYDAEGRVVGTVRWDNAVSVNDATTTAGVAGLTSGGYASTATSYDNDGRVASSTDAVGSVQYNVYNGNGTLAYTYAAYGTADEVLTRFFYDTAGRVVARADAADTAEQSLTSYAYDGLGNLVSATDSNGNTTTFTYDHLGRKASSTNAIGGITRWDYDAFGDVVKITDPNGNTSYSYYDTLGRVIASRDAENYVTETRYTTFGEVASITRRANRATNAPGVSSLPTYVADPNRDATTAFGYDRLGRVVSTTDALGYVESYTLDAFGQRLSITNKLGSTTTNTYDRRGLLVRETLPISSVRADGSLEASSVVNTFGYDARGNRTSIVEAFGLNEQRSTTYVYDKLDRLIETHLPQVQNSTNIGLIAPVEYTVYDKRGNVIERRDAAGARTLFYYDKLDRQIASIGANGTYSTITYTRGTGSGETRTSRVYGTQITLPTAGGTPPTAPGGEYRESIDSYDKLGRLILTRLGGIVTTGQLTATGYSFGSGVVGSHWEYDADGNLVRTIDPNGGSTYVYYDKLGRKIAQVDQLGYLTAWTLDAEGNVVVETRYATASSGASVGSAPTVAPSAADRTTTFTYDKNGQRLTETRLGLAYTTVDANSGAVNSVNGGNSTISYTYNALGQVKIKIEASGDGTNYIYDNIGRLIRIEGAIFVDYGNNIVQGTLDYSYDALGNLTRSLQNAVRLTRYTYGAGGRLQSTTDAGGNARVYYYDIAGRKVGEAYDRVKADGSTVAHEGLSYQYDAVGNLVRQAFATVSGGTFTDSGDVSTFTYDAYGEVTARALNGVTQERNAYDNAGHVWRSTAGDGVSRYYVYDLSGNRTLTLEDNGSPNGNLSNLSIYDVWDAATQNRSVAFGAVYTPRVNVTIMAYDARNQLVLSNQAKRQLNETDAAVDLIATRSYNAFGETVTDTDALGHVTSYTYNALGRATSVVHAAVQIGNADGSVSNGTPTDILYYDVSGRLVGQRDANGKLTTRTLLAGTGYGQSVALVRKEFHADGGVITNDYDVFADLRSTTDAVGRTTTNDYDSLGRVVHIIHAGGLQDYFSYDALGQRLRHWNNQFSDAELTDYDGQGRVVQTRAFGGDVVTTRFEWLGWLTTPGLSTYGATIATTTYANGKTSNDVTDGLGHLLWHTDMSGRVTNYLYNSAGRLVDRSGTVTQHYTYLNTGLVGHVTTGITGNPDNQDTFDDIRSTYGYDKLGEKIREQTVHESGALQDFGDYDGGWHTEYVSNSSVLQNATAQYDALGRIVSWNEAGNGTTPAASKTWSYDAVGNIRHLTASFTYLDQNGGVSPYGGSTQDYWYAYDAMNRVTTSQGTLSGGQIVRGSQGVDLTYDGAGERVTATRNASLIARGVYDPNQYNPPSGGYGSPYQLELPDDGGGGSYGGYHDVSYAGERRETYRYDASGAIQTLSVSESGYTDNGDGTVTVAGLGAAALKTAFQHDLLGRLTVQTDFIGDGTAYAGITDYSSSLPVAAYRSLSYDTHGRVASSTDVTRTGADTIRVDTINQYGDGSSYALGAVTSSSANTYKNGIFQSSSTTTTSYDWYDGAVQTRVDYSSQGSTFHTYYTNDASGQLVSANVQDGRPRWITVTRDALGQAIRRDEADTNYNANGGGDPHEIWYRFNGRQIGYIGNNGSDNGDYTASIAQRTAPSPGGTPGAFRGGASYGAAYADFDQNYDAINTFAQGSGGGVYTVRQGDTLSSIAAQLWGDASLWYKLAEANGLSGDTTLTVGQTLSTPAGVNRTGNTAGTFRPYDPSDAYGDTSPTTPKPQAARRGGCGGFGAILLAVVAIAVTIVATAGATAAISGQAFGAVLGGVTSGTAVAGVSTAAWIAGGTIGAAVGSAVSQGIGVATGLQDKFSWSGVALAALGGGVGGAIGPGGLFGVNGAFGNVGSPFVQGALRGALSSAITQGIGVATGLQSKFDFVGVAAAGIGAGISGAVSGKFGGLGSFGQSLATNAVGGLANAATRSLVNGTDFGDNILAALPDIIGNTVGGFVADQVSSALNDRETVDYLQREGKMSRAEARALLHDAQLSGIDQAGAGGGTNPNADLQNRRARLESLEATLVSSGKSNDPKFLQFKRLYELSLISGDVYLNRTDAYVTGNYKRLEGKAVSEVTNGTLAASDLIDPKSGYFSAIYRNDKTGELVYANRGTEIHDAGDRAADILQSLGKSDLQYVRAIENAEALRDNGIKVTFTGHSLGGGLATAQAVVSGYKAVVFNPAGVHKNTVGGSAILARQNSLVTNVTVDGEPLSNFQDGGKTTVGLILDGLTANPRAEPDDHFRQLAAQVPSAGGRRVTLAPAYLARPRGFYVSIPGSPGHGINSVADSLFYRYEKGW